MRKNLDLRQKKVIDADTAEQIGYIRDMDIDLASGKILSVSIPTGLCPVKATLLISTAMFWESTRAFISTP